MIWHRTRQEKKKGAIFKHFSEFQCQLFEKKNTIHRVFEYEKALGTLQYEKQAGNGPSQPST